MKPTPNSTLPVRQLALPAQIYGLLFTNPKIGYRPISHFSSTTIEVHNINNPSEFNSEAASVVQHPPTPSSRNPIKILIYIPYFDGLQTRVCYVPTTASYLFTNSSSCSTFGYLLIQHEHLLVIRARM